MKKKPPMNRAARVLWLSLAGSAWLLLLWLTTDASPAQNAIVTPMLSMDLARDHSTELSMITVEYPPGGSNPVHTHRAEAIGYVLEGSIVMQPKDGAPVTLAPGQTFHEGPDEVHVVNRNASDTAPAKLLVFLVKDKGAPVLTPVK